MFLDNSRFLGVITRAKLPSYNFIQNWWKQNFRIWKSRKQFRQWKLTFQFNHKISNHAIIRIIRPSKQQENWNETWLQMTNDELGVIKENTKKTVTQRKINNIRMFFIPLTLTNNLYILVNTFKCGNKFCRQTFLVR